MMPAGGTELLLKNLQKYVQLEQLNKANLVVSSCNHLAISAIKPNILWQHLSYDQNNVQGMLDKSFVDQINKFVYVSNWQLSKFQEYFNTPYDRSIVIQNAIEPIEYIPRQETKKLKLIYTSTPWRGLEVLLDSLDILKRDDIELDVYSSTIIYGKHFMPNAYDHLFNRCRATKNVNYRGYAVNRAIRKAVQQAHIFAYPSIFEETSCISAIEAGAAGCRIVITDLGALPETCNKYASYARSNTNKKQLAHEYAELLNYEIDMYYDNQKSLLHQSTYFNNKYSWENRKIEWDNLLNNI